MSKYSSLIIINNNLDDPSNPGIGKQNTDINYIQFKLQLIERLSTISTIIEFVEVEPPSKDFDSYYDRITRFQYDLIFIYNCSKEFQTKWNSLFF